MGKGSNVQKKQAAQLKNLAKNSAKTDEERKAAAAKAKKDSEAFMCAVCKQTFMVNARPPLLWEHVQAKHNGENPLGCFPAHLKDFDPDDPKGEKKAAADKKAAAEKAKKLAAKKKKDAAGGLDDLLSAGLSSGKKKMK